MRDHLHHTHVHYCPQQHNFYWVQDIPLISLSVQSPQKGQRSNPRTCIVLFSSPATAEWMKRTSRPQKWLVLRNWPISAGISPHQPSSCRLRNRPFYFLSLQLNSPIFSRLPHNTGITKIISAGNSSPVCETCFKKQSWKCALLLSALNWPFISFMHIICALKNCVYFNLKT